MASAEQRNHLIQAVAAYMSLPNRENWLVLRKHSRAKVRAWLADLRNVSDEEIQAEFWDTALGRFHVNIPERPDIGRSLRHLTGETDISPEALDAYLNVHPEALTGNAEAEICRKHSAFVQDVPALRAALRVLLDAGTNVIRRLNDVLDGEHRLPGFGPATATTILECWNDGNDETGGPLYSKWTGHTERTLGTFGLFQRGESSGETYRNIWESEKRLITEFGSFRNLSDIDLFMFFVDPRGLDMGRH